MESFYLEPNEELFSIIDRIKRSRDENITLIVPSGLSTLRSIINLRILKEEAISLGKDISLVTPDALIRKLAQQANLRILDKEPGQKKEESWAEQLKRGGEVRPRPRIEEPKRMISDIISPERQIKMEEKKEELVKESIEEPVFAEPVPSEEKEEVFYRPKKAREYFRIFTKKRMIIAAIVLCLIVAGFVLYFILPKVQITINPKKETIRFETKITADKNIDSVDFTNNSIPGQVFQLEMEESKKFPTTGEKEIEEKARGNITVYNQYSSIPQTLVETTRFLSEEGKIFRLADTVVIPGATIEEGVITPSSKEVEVIADESGESYNISPSKFTIPGLGEGSPKYMGFYGYSTEPMTGGAKGKIQVATKNDIDRAVETVSVELRDKIQEQFNKKIPKDLKLLKDAQVLEITESNSSLKADESGKEFIVAAKAMAWALVFKEEDIFHLIEKNIGDKISESKFLLPITIKVDYTNIETDSTQGRADLSCQIQANVAWKLDEEKIKNDLAGKDEIEVRRYLSSLSEIESAKVVFWPFWVKRIPQNKSKIRVIIEAK